MRPPLHLDFIRPHAPQPRLGLALLVAGAVALGVALAEHQRAAAERARVEARIADTQRMARRDLAHLRGVAADSKALAEEVRNANAVLGELTVPWDALFREIEAASDATVALLSIQPDAAARAVRIAGEARRFEDVVGYLGRLEAQPGLAEAVLARHEFRGDGAAPAVAFTIVAQWRDAVPAATPAPAGPRAAALAATHGGSPGYGGLD